MDGDQYDFEAVLLYILCDGRKIDTELDMKVGIYSKKRLLTLSSLISAEITTHVPLTHGRRDCENK